MGGSLPSGGEQRGIVFSLCQYSLHHIYWIPIVVSCLAWHSREATHLYSGVFAEFNILRSEDSASTLYNSTWKLAVPMRVTNLNSNP